METYILLESRDNENIVYPTSDIPTALGYNHLKCSFEKREKVQN